MNSPSSEKPVNQEDPAYWPQVRSLTFRILTVWVLLVLVVVVLAPSLSETVFGIPLGYWLISSTLLPSFLILVVVYALRMDRLESSTIENSNERLNQSAPSSTQQHGGPDAGDSTHESQRQRGQSDLR